MILRCHIDREFDGIVILESEPQMRNIISSSEIKNSIYVPMPYIIFTVRYKKHKNEFIYPGVFGCGLHVHGCRKSLTSINDDVVLLPTDDYANGLVCTDHRCDNRRYDSITNLVNDVITMWWNSRHN